MVGLIPARAGKTYAFQGVFSRDGAHPRAGGENWTARGGPASAAGSSPRGRGKPQPPVMMTNRMGLIPARAGKTVSSARAPTVRAAHPRAGGENDNFISVAQSMGGSSPRGRGKPSRYLVLRDPGRLIPARAGKTPGWELSTLGAAAHPRAGGENAPTGATAARLRWLIPARAGKTHAAAKDPAKVRAHPRAGGENTVYAWYVFVDRGSSPRGRGKRRKNRAELSNGGLIPARAGKTKAFP